MRRTWPGTTCGQWRCGERRRNVSDVDDDKSATMDSAGGDSSSKLCPASSGPVVRVNGSIEECMKPGGQEATWITVARRALRGEWGRIPISAARRGGGQRSETSARRQAPVTGDTQWTRHRTRTRALITVSRRGLRSYRHIQVHLVRTTLAMVSPLA